MTDLIGTFTDESGVTRLDGTMHVPAGVNADFLNGVGINNSPSGAGEYLTSVNGANVAYLLPTVRIAAGVPAGAPVSPELPIAIDTTAVTGGVYGWNGAAWVKGATI